MSLGQNDVIAIRPFRVRWIVIHYIEEQRHQDFDC